MNLKRANGHMKAQLFSVIAICICITSALFIDPINSSSSVTATIQTSGTISPSDISLTIILRNTGVFKGSESSIIQQVDTFVTNHPHVTAITIADMQQYGIWWYGYSFSPTNGTWSGATFNQLKTMIDRFHYHGWKVGLETTGVAWNNLQEYNYITSEHPELAFTDANGIRATGIDNTSALTKNPGFNNVIPDYFAKFATDDSINNISKGTRLIDLYTTRLTQMILDGLKWDFWFGTDGWNGLNIQGYKWSSAAPTQCYSFSIQEENEYAAWAGNGKLPTNWNELTNIQRATAILQDSNLLNNWFYYWQIRFAQMYAQIKQAFINAGQSQNAFHVIGGVDESSEPNGNGNLSPAGMYNMSLLAEYNSVDYLYVNQENVASVGATYALGREQSYAAALAKMQSPLLNTIIGLQLVNYRGGAYPLWEVEQEYLSQAVNYVWFNGIQYRVSAPNIMMIQYSSGGGFNGWTQSEINQLFNFIGEVSKSLINAEPIWLGPTYTIPNNYSPMAWWSLNFSIAQWVSTANIANNPQYINQNIGTILMDQTLYWNGPRLTGLYDKMVNQLWGNNKLNLWFYENVPSTGISAIWGGNEQEARTAFHLNPSSGTATSFSIPNGLTDPVAKWIAAGYEGSTYSVANGYTGVYSAGSGFIPIASADPNSSSGLAIGYYKNATTSNFLLTNSPSGPYANGIVVPRSVMNKMLYWVSNCPINSSEPLIDLKILNNGSTVLIPMTNQKDVGNSLGSNIGWIINSVLNIDASALGLESPEQYHVYWAAEENSITVTDWNSVPISLKGMADVLVIEPL